MGRSELLLLREGATPMTLVCTANLTAVRDWNWAGIEFWMLLNDDDFQVSLLPMVALDIHKLESLFGSPGWRLCLV